MSESITLMLPDLIGGLVSVTAAIVLLARGFRTPAALRRVFAAMAVIVTCAGLILVFHLPIMEWTAIGISAVAVLALLKWLPSAASEISHHTADLEQLRVLEAAVTASGDGVMVADTVPNQDRGPRVVFANPAFEQIMGYSAEEVVGLSPSVFCPIGANSISTGSAEIDTEAEATALDAIRMALRGTEPVRLELPGRRKDGSKVWVEWQVVPVPDTSGRFKHWVAVLRDTTERRRLEDQLRQSSKMEAVGRLAGGIAHDFNNLLTVIGGNTSMILQGGFDVPLDELVSDIADATDRAAALVRQLLTFSSKQPARPEVVDLNAIVTGLAGLLRRLLGERITVATVLAHEEIRTRIDRGQLEQVIVNLAVNARDAMANGGTLTITTSELRTPAGAFARLVVSDTGCGMTEKVKARIFEPFFTTKGLDKGTGLGLATVYGIVKHANGRIALDSTPGVGTTFRVDLPWSDAVLSPVSGMNPIPAGLRSTSEGKGRSVLLVEDEEAVRRFARVALEGQGYEVEEAIDGESALGMLKRVKRIPDLLVTDLSMPGIGGRELAGHVRTTHPSVGVVFVSGYAPDADRLGGVSGAVFLPKPFSPTELVKAARRALNGTAVGAA